MFANKIHEEGHDYMKKGDLEKAIECYGRSLLLNPEHPDIFSDRGVVYIHLKMKTEAMADFNMAVTLQPEYSYRYSARAYARDFFGDTEGAIEDYEKAIELDPDDAVAYNNLGLLQEKLGYNLKAKQNFERADKLSKMENNFFKIMDELEQQDIVEEQSTIDKVEKNKQSEATKHEMIDPTEIREQNISTFREFKRIFTSKQQFSEFLRFIKNGFKIK